MELGVCNHFAELKYLFRSLVNEFVVNIAAIIGLTVSILIRTRGTLDVPHCDRCIIWWNQTLAICTLRNAIDMILMHICKGVSELDRTSELWISLIDHFLQRMEAHTTVTRHRTSWGACCIWNLQKLLLIVLQLIVGSAFWENYLTVWLQESVYKCWLLVNLIKRLELNFIAAYFIHELLAQLE